MVNRRSIEALVRAGAFDSVNEHRASLLASVGIALEAAEQAERNANQASLFGAVDDTVASVVRLVAAERWSGPEQLAQEKAALGFYFSAHPFEYYAGEIASFVKSRLADLAPRQEAVLLAGIIVSTRLQQTRSGRMAVITLEDGTAQLEVTAYSELFEEARDLLREDQPVVIQGRVSEDQFSGGLRVRAERILDLPAARSRFARLIRLSLNGAANSEGDSGVVRLRKLLEPYRGNGACPVEIRYENGDASVSMRLSEQWRVNLDDPLLQALRAWLEPENVEVVYS